MVGYFLHINKLPRCHASWLSSHRVLGILFTNSSSFFAAGDCTGTGTGGKSLRIKLSQLSTVFLLVESLISWNLILVFASHTALGESRIFRAFGDNTIIEWVRMRENILLKKEKVEVEKVKRVLGQEFGTGVSLSQTAPRRRPSLLKTFSSRLPRMPYRCPKCVNTFKTIHLYNRYLLCLIFPNLLNNI